MFYRLIFLSVVSMLTSLSPVWADRVVVSLNGNWDIAQGTEIRPSEDYTATVPVPGLVDLASTRYQDVGVQSDRREYFWYRTHFNTPDRIFSHAEIKIWKAKYGIRVWLNGEDLGQHLYNFSAGSFEVGEHLQPAGKENELVVRVGANPSVLPENIVPGNDFEKIKYIPGIYDDVQLILTGKPRIENIQVVPDVENGTVEVHTWLKESDLTREAALSYIVKEAESGRIVAEATMKTTSPESSCLIALNEFKQWSPVSPFLYRVIVKTEGDSYSTLFGMRSFQFNADTGFAELNGETYFLRGTNICLYRFFEDQKREDLPWDETWVRGLFQTVKDMRWNSLRFCIGLVPEFWYNICDEMGILVQDEYPIWYGAEEENFPDGITVDDLVNEYSEWMRERWNHPCVVIWDAQNESVTNKTGQAISIVRNLDKSNRPWDNGYGPPQAPTDPIESHPYIFDNYFKIKPSIQGALYDWLRERRIPDNGPTEHSPPDDGGVYPNPIQNNENVFCWITREGEPTWLMQWVYLNILEEQFDSPDGWYDYYAYLYRRIISYWRSHRTSATVQEFCLLGYSRPMEQEGYTSDNFVDVKNLVFKPYYKEAAYAAFYPVGLLIDRWEEKFNPGKDVDIPIVMINDYNREWRGQIDFRMVRAGESQPVWRDSLSMSVGGHSRASSSIQMSLPRELGNYMLLATYGCDDEQIEQQYRFEIIDEPLPDSVPNPVLKNQQYIHSSSK